MVLVLTRTIVKTLILVAMFSTTALLDAKPAKVQPPAPKPEEPDRGPDEAASRGQMLYENHCTECHISVVHVREQHRADTPAAVRGWVVKWANFKDLDWSARDIEDVSDFLSEHYYRFDTQP